MNKYKDYDDSTLLSIRENTDKIVKDYSLALRFLGAGLIVSLAAIGFLLLKLHGVL